MEVKKGFKQTEIGVLPEDWDVVALGRMVRSVEYGSSSKSLASGAVPVIRMGNLQNGKIDWSDLVYTDTEAEIKRYSLRRGDVLFNRTNTIELVGKSSIYEGERPAIFAGYLIRINTLPGVLDTRYLNYILNTEMSRKHSAKVLSVAVGQANINGQKLKTYPVPMPPTMAEQEAIAGALSDADAWIESLEQLIAKKRQIKQGAMQELLTGKRRLPGFSGEWETKRLTSVAVLESGHTPSKREPSYWGGSIPWVSLHDTDRLNVREIFATEQSISVAGLNHSSARLLPKGTVIFSRTASVGKSTVLGREMATSQDFANYVCGPELHNHFLVYLFRSMGPIWKRLMAGSIHNTIYMPVFKSLRILIPTIAEQVAITEVLESLDADVDELQKKHAKALQIKQGMMQELLTGRIRLI